jgi:ABC-type antimicrobial peptide transport system permease subunit
LLGVIGSIVGLLCFLLVVYAVFEFQPYWMPPQLANSIPLEIYIVPAYVASSSAALTLLSLCAGIFPARNVSRRNIVEALGHA